MGGQVLFGVSVSVPTYLSLEESMDKDFSEGFMHDIADLLECCKENNTDNVDLKFTFEDLELKVNITFSIKQN